MLWSRRDERLKLKRDCGEKDELETGMVANVHGLYAALHSQVNGVKARARNRTDRHYFVRKHAGK